MKKATSLKTEEPKLNENGIRKYNKIKFLQKNQTSSAIDELELFKVEEIHTEKSEQKISLSSEKVYLEGQTILSDITQSINCPDTLKPLNSTRTPKSTENLNKRKFEMKSPDIIPPTPQKAIEKCIKNKSTPCIENKIDTFINKPILSPPLKRICTIESVQSTTDDFDDFFDDDWDVDLNEIEDKMYQLNLETWQYCKILEISKDNFQNLILKLQSVENKQQTICILQGVWQYSNLQVDDFINIKAIKNSNDIPFCINNNSGFLVYEPDVLISPTSIVGSQFCKRRGILQEKFRGFEPENKIMILGTLVHKLLQDVLKKEVYKTELVEKRLLDILSSKEMINTSYSSQVPIEELKSDLLPFIPKILNFVEKYVRNNKNKSQKTSKSEDWQGKISSIEDIEENIWCPQLGIKGKIDITVKSNSFDITLPLELKTGRATMSLEHRGQVAFYIMMMAELGYNVSSGLLLYLREETMKEVTTSHRENRDLLMLRNEFVYYMKQKPKVDDDLTEKIKFSALPEPIHHHNACEKCPYVDICTVVLSRDDTYTLSDTHPLRKISTECLAHLDANHIDYFIHWTSLLTLESTYRPPIKEIKDIWRLPPYKRENRGKSLSHLKISSRVTEQNDCFIHSFTRSTDQTVTDILTEKGLNNDFLLSGLNAGNYVVISASNRTGIATGFITNITSNSVTVSLERDLNERYRNKIFHLDTYESQQIVNFSYTSVAALLNSSGRAKRLRELIIDRQSSIFSDSLTKSVLAKGAEVLRKLNKIQQRAVLKALTAQDYLLIKGMPGTGKTATIVALVEVLVKLNKTVLITSHTHSAVDNVCLRLLQNGVEILRLGSEKRVHPLLKHRTETVLTAGCKTVEEMKEIYDKSRVVAVTCLATAHPFLSQKRLDVCIVDESTQVIQCSVIKALLSCNSFILIGDPDQLPPVVRNPEAVRRGMNESLFERLDNLNATLTLTLQYRMNKIITDLANSVTYKGELLCGDENIATAVLNMPNFENFTSVYKTQPLILDILKSNLESSVVTVNTGATWNLQEKTDDLLSDLQVAPQNVQEDEERKCSNNFEASLVISIVKALKVAGVSSDSIGVIAPYRAQVCLLKKYVSNIYAGENCEPAEVNTVDQYQGRDKDVIIYSCTRSRNVNKPKNNTGFEILDDHRRLTVAITRAKHKLIIIGDFDTLKEYSPFEKLLESLENHQKISLKDVKYNFNWTEAVKCL